MIWRSALFVVGFSWVGVGLLAQPIDTSFVSVTVEQDTANEVPVFNEKHGANGVNDYRKSWFKLDIVDLFPRFETPVDELGFSMSLTHEVRITPRFAWNTIIGMQKDRYILTSAQDDDYTPLALYAGVQARWFPQFLDFNEEKTEALSGNYLALRYDVKYRDKFWYNYPIDNPQSSVTHYFSLLGGLQRRILGSGFLDIGLGFQFWTGNKPLPYYTADGTLRHRSANSSGIGLYYQLGLGFALFTQNYNTAKERSADDLSKFFSYQVAEHHLVKINLLELIKTVDYSAAYNKLKLKGDVTFEQKIGRSFSINIGGIAATSLYSRKKSLSSNGALVANKITATLEAELAPRWYYNLPRRIATGKSANNLSANYLSLAFNYRQQIGEESLNPNAIAVPKAASLALLYGLQRRIFNHGYLDYRLGIGQRIIKSALPQLFFISDLKIGLAF